MSRLTMALLFAAFVGACGGEAGDDGGLLDSTLTVRNASSFTFVEINISPIDQLRWGPDLLGAEVLEPGDALEIGGIDCDTYDVRVIDDLDGECILENIDLCLDDAVWTLTDGDLLSCDGLS
jgi:hypothetical protein